MSLVFYPYMDDVGIGSLSQRIESLMEAAERYKAAIMDVSSKDSGNALDTRHLAPKDIPISYNWEAIATVLREIREMPEASKEAKELKARSLDKLAEIYEVLRDAKMPKLESVRIALTSEANQLRGGATAKPI